MTTNNAMWFQLYEFLTDVPEGESPGRLLVDEESAENVLVQWQDSSTSSLWWHDNHWVILGSVDAASCDRASNAP